MKPDPVITAAIRWWKNRRPCAWNEAEHLATPRVNCVTEAESKLATAVAAHIKELRKTRMIKHQFQVSSDK